MRIGEPMASIIELKPLDIDVIRAFHLSAIQKIMSPAPAAIVSQTALTALPIPSAATPIA